MASLIDLARFCSSLPQCWNFPQLVYDLWCHIGYRWVRGPLDTLETLSKCSTRFTSIFFFTFHTATLVSVYHLTFLKECILVCKLEPHPIYVADGPCLCTYSCMDHWVLLNGFFNWSGKVLFLPSTMLKFSTVGVWLVVSYWL